MRMKFLDSTLKGTKLYIGFVLVLSVMYSRLVVEIPMFIQYVLDGVIMGDESVIPVMIRNLFYSDDKISRIVVLVLVLIGINLVIFIVNYLKSKINTKFNLIINRNVKELILGYIPRIEYVQFSNIDKSNVIQRVNNDASTYSEFFNSQIVLFFDTIFIIVFAVVETFKLNSVVAFFIGIVCVLIILISVWYFRVSRPLVEDIVEMNREVINRTTISIEEAKMLKLFNRKEKEIQEFSDMNGEYKRKDIRLAKIKVLYVIGTHTLRNFKEPFVLLLGGILVIRGELTLSMMSILLTYSTKVLQYVYNSVDKLKNVNEFFVAYRKLSDLMNLSEDVEENPDVVLDGDIVFENVSVRINDNIVLEDLNFVIHKNEKVAIIGDNGTGKTVILKTLMGFYEYTGKIYIGDYEIKTVSKKSVRDYIGLVLQDMYLFTDTIENNINITNKGADEEEIVEACKIAEIYDDVMSFDGRMNYVIGKGGNNISGGQRQRLAIARTLIKGNGFVIFDDSLSKLDAKTKVRILDNILYMQVGLVIVSYDFEVVRRCDKVLFINDKTIVVGEHDELMRKYELYRNLLEVGENKILEDEEFG